MAPEPWDRRRDRRALVLLFLVAWTLYLATATYDSFQINDNRAVNLSAWNLGVRGTFELPSEWAGGNRWIVEGSDGALYTNRFPGAIVWAAPFHGVSHALFGEETPDHPISLNYAPGGVAAATAAALSVGVSFLVLRRLADRRLAVLATGALAFGTAVWSINADSMWTHSLTTLALMLGVLGAASGRYARGGLAFAASVLARPHTAVVPAVMGIWASVHHRQWRPMLVVGATSFLGVIAMALYSQWLFGTWVPVAGYSTSQAVSVVTTSSSETLENILYTLGHPARGAMIYTPALLVLVPFVRHGWRASPAWVHSAAIGGVLYLIIQLRVNTWMGGAGFFGSRLTIETIVLLTPLLLRTWQTVTVKSERLKGACVGLLVVGVLVHGYGALHPVPVENREAWQAEMDRFCREVRQVSACEDDG